MNDTGTRTSPILRLGTKKGHGASRTMKNRMIIIAISVATLVASSTMADWTFVRCDIWWGTANFKRPPCQDINAPGCKITGFCYTETWSKMPGFSTSSPNQGLPCTVYRDGVPVFVVNASGDTQSFSDLDVVPGQSYTYTVGGYRGGMTSPVTAICTFIYTAEFDKQKLTFAADDNISTKKALSVSLYKQTVEAKEPISRKGVNYTLSDNWIGAEMTMDGFNIWVVPNETDVSREGTVTISYNGFSWPIKVTQTGKSTSTSYSSWAAANGLSGAWDAKDASGIYNVFRYVFNMPVDDFSKTPLMGISFVDGKPVIKTPEIVNSSGFTLSVVASDFVDGTGNVMNYTLNASGETRIEEARNPSRFFRLKVNSAQ